MSTPTALAAAGAAPQAHLVRSNTWMCRSAVATTSLSRPAVMLKALSGSCISATGSSNPGIRGSQIFSLESQPAEASSWRSGSQVRHRTGSLCEPSSV